MEKLISGNPEEINYSENLKDINDLPAEDDLNIAEVPAPEFNEVSPQDISFQDNNSFTEDPNSNPDEYESYPENIKPVAISELELPSLLLTIKKIFSAISEDEIFISIPQALCELLNAEHGRVYLIDKENDEFKTGTNEFGDYQDIKIKYNHNLFTEAVNNKQIINLINPPLEELEKISSGTDTHSILIFPLAPPNGDITGLVELDNSVKGKFDGEDEAVLTSLSQLIILALENAGLIHKLLDSERMTSLNKIANFLIQDIQNPIVTIKQYAEHIKKQDIKEDILPVLDMIEEQADTVMNLVQTTLRYSDGILISKPKTILLSTALDNILSLLAEYVESRKVKLFKKYEGDGLVNLDRKEFYQASFQIAKNACDAMPQGGNFYVIVTRQDDSIKIEFKDTGIGIPESIKERIFEPFMSHGKENHTGLGLAIVEKVVKEHNGKILVDSDLGEGTSITIVLPTAD